MRVIETGTDSDVEVQYNLDTSPGTSGSPVFHHKGVLVATNNHAGIWDGVALNFGIHVDALWGFLDWLESSRGQMPPAMPQRAYPDTEYQPLPENWNGETIGP